jgi:hypothetical protein
MQLSAEVRWFGLGSIPDDLRNWFLEPASAFGYPAGGGHRKRPDVYLRLKEPELSIKKRGGKEGFEVKGLVDTLPWQFQLGKITVPREPQLLCKWGSTELQVANVPVVETEKLRWLRKFDTIGDPREIQLGAGEFGEDPLLPSERPDVGCNIELTLVTTGGTRWWTFGAESFAFKQPGQTTALVSQGLQQVMRALSSRATINLGDARYYGYGEWIAAME